MPPQLTELQVAILRVLWDLGEASVVAVHEVLREERSVAESTIATLLSRMERKQLVNHRTEGRVYRYRAQVSEAEVSQVVTREYAALASRLTSRGISALLGSLLGTTEVTAADLEQAAKLIQSKADELKAEGENRD